MRESIKQYVEMVAQTLPIAEPIYEFGSLQVPGQEGFADLRSLFSGKKYVGADIQTGPGVDVVLNLHHINLPSESTGTVLILDTLEHVEHPAKAIEEAYRILKPRGLLVISSVMNFPIHDYPSDYWRFTPEGFRSLLKEFTYVQVDFAGKSEFPHTVVGLACKSALPKKVAQDFSEKVKHWKKRWSQSPESRFGGLVRRLVR